MFEILVMGGSQFVSQSLAAYLIEKGYTVDIFTRGLRQIQYEGVRNHLVGDRNREEDLERNLADKKYDFIFDITAYDRSHIDKLLSNINMEKMKRYVFFSTGGVYLPSEDYLMEAHSATGKHPELGTYGINKKEAEDYLFGLNKKGKLPMSIFRPPYIYGEGNNLYREAYLFTRVEQSAVIPYPKGGTKVHFVHIEDVVKVLESVMYDESSDGEAYNLSYPEDVSWEQLLASAEKAVGKTINSIEVDEGLLDQEMRTIHYFPYLNFMYKLGTEKLLNSGLYTPSISLEEGMKRAYRYFQEERPVFDDSLMKVEEVLKVVK
jgi:nucleoside-diphosphate-sugar epimerase